MVVSKTQVSKENSDSWMRYDGSLADNKVAVLTLTHYDSIRSYLSTKDTVSRFIMFRY